MMMMMTTNNNNNNAVLCLAVSPLRTAHLIEPTSAAWHSLRTCLTTSSGLRAWGEADPHAAPQQKLLLLQHFVVLLPAALLCSDSGPLPVWPSELEFEEALTCSTGQLSLETSDASTSLRFEAGCIIIFLLFFSLLQALLPLLHQLWL